MDVGSPISIGSGQIESPSHRSRSTPILGFESAAVAPAYFIRGLNPDQFDDVLSGITYGWLNSNCALAVQTAVGAGKLLLITYRFDSYGTDPYATELLNSFIAWINATEMQPKTIGSTELLPRTGALREELGS